MVTTGLATRVPWYVLYTCTYGNTYSSVTSSIVPNLYQLGMPCLHTGMTSWRQKSKTRSCSNTPSQPSDKQTNKPSLQTTVPLVVASKQAGKPPHCSTTVYVTTYVRTRVPYVRTGTYSSTMVPWYGHTYVRVRTRVLRVPVAWYSLAS